MVPFEVRAKILAELELPGCVVSELAKSYNVSTTSIYSWRREAEAEASSANKFALLSIKEPLPSSSLQKASLIFDQFSLILEGNIKTKALLSIIQILEEESC
jgi:transposase-like protein